MRPYLAIMKDSIREALASRVLYFVLGALSLFLGGLAPLGMEATVADRVSFRDLVNPAEFKEILLSAPSDELAGRLRENLSQDLQNDLKSVPDSQIHDVNRRIMGEIDQMLSEEALFAGLGPSPYTKTAELKKLEEGGLQQSEIRRFNRLILDEALTGAIRPVEGVAFQLSYGPWPIGDPFPIPEAIMGTLIRTMINGAMSVILGVIGIMVAILVTAPMIPQTFEPGAIDLLLSKPVSRSLVFLTKFLGGCVFITLSTTFFLTGIWLIMGFRFHLWEYGILYCIPLFLFAFMIYYSVSALAGLIWRNSVVSVTCVVVFWLICFLLGTGNEVLGTVFLRPREIARIMPTSSSILMANRRGDVHEWNTTENNWSPVFEERRGNAMNLVPGYPLIGPEYDQKQDRISAIWNFPMRRRFGVPSRFLTATREGGWQARGSGSPPSGITDLAATESGLLAVGSGGIYRYKESNNGPTALNQVLDAIGMGGQGSSFQSIKLSGERRWRSPTAASINRKTAEIAVLDPLGLAILSPEGAEYRFAREFPWNENTPALLAFAGNIVCVALEDGRVYLIDATTGATILEGKTVAEEAPRLISIDPKIGLVAVLTHAESISIWDSITTSAVSIKTWMQGNITSCHFDQEGKLWVADRLNRLVRYSLPDWEIEEEFNAPGDALHTFYHSVLSPAYQILPKPGELTTVTNYLLTGKSTVATQGPVESTLQTDQIKQDLYTPIWSNLAFVVVMLLLGCRFVSRKDF